MMMPVSGEHDPKRVEKDTGERRGVLALLIVATIVAAVCGVVPSIWAVRAGVLVALVGAWISVFMAWRQVDAIRRMHFDTLKELRHAASEQEKRHHAESMEMIDTFSRRVGSISKTLADTRAKLDRAESELSTLRGDKAALQYKVTAGNKKVASLEMRITELETELDALLADGRSGRLTPCVPSLMQVSPPPRRSGSAVTTRLSLICPESLSRAYLRGLARLVARPDA